jgi:hypothetical protein
MPYVRLSQALCSAYVGHVCRLHGILDRHASFYHQTRYPCQSSPTAPRTEGSPRNQHRITFVAGSFSSSEACTKELQIAVLPISLYPEQYFPRISICRCIETGADLQNRQIIACFRRVLMPRISEGQRNNCLSAFSEGQMHNCPPNHC